MRVMTHVQQRQEQQGKMYCDDDRHTQKAHKLNKGRLIESNPNGHKTLKPVSIGWGDDNTQRNCVHVQFEQTEPTEPTTPTSRSMSCSTPSMPVNSHFYRFRLSSVV